MYVIVEDLTNQRVGCENTIFIHGTFEALVDAIAAANKAYENVRSNITGNVMWTLTNIKCSPE